MTFSPEQLRTEFVAALSVGGVDAADRLCACCVELMDVDGAAVSLLYQGVAWGTVGSSGGFGRQLDELQFNLGEGPCWDAVSQSQPVLVADLAAPAKDRWPAFTTAALDRGIHAVFAIPIPVDGIHIGALDLSRRRPGPLDRRELGGGLLAADTAGALLSEYLKRIISSDPGGGDRGGESAGGLARIEIYQATGMVMSRLNVGPNEALVRIRSHAASQGLTVRQVAWAIVERRLLLGRDTTDSSSDPAGPSQ